MQSRIRSIFAKIGLKWKGYEKEHLIEYGKVTYLVIAFKENDINILKIYSKDEFSRNLVVEIFLKPNIEIKFYSKLDSSVYIYLVIDSLWI